MLEATSTTVPKRPRCVERTPMGSLAAAFETIASSRSDLSWPSQRYADDPVAFCRDILGIEPWSKQVDVLEAVRDHDRVAVRSGHKCGKSHIAACVALWFYCTRPDARVCMTSVTARQVDAILWRELKKLHARAGRCLACIKGDPRGPRPCPHSGRIDGSPNDLARNGLHSPDFREVSGFTAKEAEGVAGISGANVLYICDEASGIPEKIFEAIEGNRAGGGRILMISNPTRTEGTFFDAFHTKAGFFITIHISSEDSPNVVFGRVTVPGLATRGWVDEKRQEWGEESPLYKVRVRGDFVRNEEGKIISLQALEDAEGRLEDTAASGRLCIGCDPAGPGDGGDEVAFAWKRGFRHLGLLTHFGLTEDAIVAKLVGLVREHRLPSEGACPLVVLDAEGPIGSRVLGLLRAHLDRYPGEFELSAVYASHRAQRQPNEFDRVRDEIWARLAQWVKEGGAIIGDTKLLADLHAPSWVGQVNGRLKVTPKSELRQLLGRSPDRGDAVCLMVHEPRNVMADALDDGPAARAVTPYDDLDGEDLAVDRVFDPYAGGFR